MTAPDPDTFRAVLGLQDLTLADERINQAVAGHLAMRPQLEELRARPLSYLEPVSEPASALAWIEWGGVR